MKSSNTLRSSNTPTFNLITGVCILTIKFFVFLVMAGLIVEILFMLFSVYNTCNWLKISEYEAYWLTDFQLINVWAHAKKILVTMLSVEAVCTTYKSKETSIRKN